MFRAEEFIRPNIRTIEPYSSARSEYSGAEGTFLDANENPYGNLNRYPDPYQHVLKRRLSEIKNVAPENIFIGNGSDEVIDLAFRVFCRPGIDKVVILTPTYGMYKVLAHVNDTDVIEVPLTQDFGINYPLLKNILETENAKVLFLCSPNNPTGNTVIDIECLLSAFKGIVFIDEAYIDFSDQESFITKLNHYPNVIVSQTMSKAWGLAAARIGIAYADQAIISIFNKVKSPYNVSKLNADAALKALANEDRFAKRISKIKKQKKYLIKSLNKLQFVIRVYPSDANFLLIEFMNSDKVYRNLITEKIITRNRSSIIPNCIRITVGSKSQNKNLIKTLKKMYV